MKTMRKGQIHPSTYLYQDMLAKALISLLYAKKLDQITISELCDQAKVSRRTFYRHFHSKNEVVNYYVTQIMKGLAFALKEQSKQGRRSFVFAFFDFLEPYTQLFLVLHSNGLDEIVFTSYIMCVTTLTFSIPPLQENDQNASQNEQCYMAFLLGGLWSVFTYWIINGSKSSPAELMDIVCSSE